MLNHTMPNANRGFTLLEVMLSTLVVFVFLMGMVKFLNVQQQAITLKEDKQQLQYIKEALLAYAVSYGRLPCPANSNGEDERNASTNNSKSCGVNNVGVVGSGSTNIRSASVNEQRRVVVGELPYKDLQVPRTDRYGNAYVYVVTLHYADFEHPTEDFGRFRDPTPFPQSKVSGLPTFNLLDGTKEKAWRTGRCLNALSRTNYPNNTLRPTFTNCSKGGVRLIEKALNGTEIVAYNDMAFAVITLGENGQNVSNGSSEFKNTKRNNNGQFVNANTSGNQNDSNREVFIKDSQSSGFDDQVVWASPYELAQYLLSAGTLP